MAAGHARRPPRDAVAPREQCSAVARLRRYINMAAFSSHEDELLVELVAINPSLFDGRLPSYRDTIVRENIWEEIGKRLNKTSNECKKRWKYIRDSYSRCKRKSKLPAGSSASSKITKWMLFERLRFLDNIPTEKTSTATVKDENIEGETNDETSTAVKSELKSSSEERSGGLTSNEGTSEAAIDTAGISGLRRSSEERNQRTSIEGTSGTGIGRDGTIEVGRKGRKRKTENNIHASLQEYWKERDKERQVQMRTMTAQEPVADVDGIDSFCAHMGSVLKQLPPGLRVEAKTKLFNVLAEFEMKSLYQRSKRSNVSFSPDSNDSYPTVITEPTCYIEEDPNYLFISD